MAEAPKPQVPVLKDDQQRLTGLKKRQQIEVAGRTMFVWVAVAAAAVSFCAATAQYLFVKWQYNNKVLSAKYTAEQTLTTNIANAKSLTEEVNALVANNDLASVKTNPSDPNTKSVLDALPPTFDPAALATSLQQVILNRSGVTVENITVPQETGASTEGVTGPQEMKFTFVVAGDYGKIKTMLTDLERTIRPMKITSISITGSDASLRASVEVTTYYQPAKTVEVKSEVVR